MTKQEIFDKIVAHARKQKEQSLYVYGNSGLECCMYRDKQGRSCFIGALIPDSLYDPLMEHNLIYMLLNGWPELYEHIGIDVDINFLYEIQNIHDTYIPYMWEQNLCELAKKHMLSYQTPNKDSL